MTNHCVSVLAFAFLAALTFSQATYTGSINTVNSPNATTAGAQDYQVRRDDWCGKTNVQDRNYNASMQFYYRSIRGNFLGNWVSNVVSYLNGGTTTQFIQTMKWPFGLILTMLCICFITWIVFMVFICNWRKGKRSEHALTFCLRFSKLLLALFFGLFILVMILIAFSEIYQRHSKCQILNVGNMLVNGYVSQMNGNQYVGIVAQAQAVMNFQNDAANVAGIYNNANNILGTNYLSSTTNAITLLQAVAANYSTATTTNALGINDQPFSIRQMTEFISLPAQVEFNNLFSLGSTLDSAAKAVVALVQNNAQAVGSQNIATTVTTLNSFFANLTSDALYLGNGAYYQLRNGFTYASGPYWAVFGISIIIIVMGIYLVSKLMLIQSNHNEPRNFKFLRIQLAVLGFFLFCYALFTILLISGSATISVFCNILANVNQGNLAFLDPLNISWQGNSKQLLKECTIGATGNVWNFLSLRPDASNAVFANNIQNIILGLTNYNNFYVNSQINGSSAIAFTNAQFAAINAGILQDFVGIQDQFNFLSASWPFGSNGRVLSLSTYNCSALSAANFTNCLPLDNSLLTSFDANPSSPSYANFTIVRNLQNYIQSEQALLSQISWNLNGRLDMITPGQAFHNVRVALGVNQNDVKVISNQFGTTLKPFSQYQGQAIYTFDCRNIQRELNVLEDQYCFNLNYWVNNLLIIVAISLCILFIFSWVMFIVIHEADTEGEISNFPIPVAENKADINEREMIPQA